MASAAVLALVKLLQIPISLFATLDLGGSLYPPERNLANNTCLDYIVVGAGTAGCAIAARLSENPDETVLLLEAGGNPPLIYFLPPAFALAPRSEVDYNYKSEYDSYAASSQDYYTKFTAGKVLGGTSVISHFIQGRGRPEDYDEWSEITNDPTWTYENVLPYFKKKEKLEDPEILNSKYRDLHGLNGPNSITREPKPYSTNYINAFNETGSRTPLDLTGDEIGVAESIFSVNSKGIRQHTANTYLTPARMRKNLYVYRYTRAIRIIFEGKRAVAVVAVKNGKKYVYRARKEIIISAGVFNSAQLLMLSGIGPKEHLNSLNIPVKADLPVGDNFQDQVAVSVVHQMESALLPPLSSINLFNVPFPVIDVLASLNPNQSYAEYQVFALLLYGNTPFLTLACADVFQFKPELCDKFNEANLLHNTLYALPSITRPHSRGSVRLRSTNPFDDPVITSGYFTNKKDVDDMVRYIINYLKVENSTYFKDVDAKLVNPELEECRNYTFRTEEYWSCYVLHTAGSLYHSVGTCAMGSVVDGRLRVKGVTNLRVADASVFPTLLHGSPYETVLMIAEKAADMIKGDSHIKSTFSAS